MSESMMCSITMSKRLASSSSLSTLIRCPIFLSRDTSNSDRQVHIS
ncbi:Uncharacterised protein [Segatella copri]|nr:Uncharacterised protein [Segatella copri]